MIEQQTRFRTLMGRFVTGVAVIAVPLPHEVAAMTANSIAAVSLNPLLLLCCIRNESRLLPRLLTSGRFSVNVLASDQASVSHHYSGRVQARSPANWVDDTSGIPFLVGAVASFACDLHSTNVAGDHTVVYGAVRRMHASDGPCAALVYASGRYCDLALA